ncbi:MAG: hypothetical protein NTY02_19455, partial [Acidobacteria bacterium]|nr:hypothetical protein [Acidobacteriota bacterium]
GRVLPSVTEILRGVGLVDTTFFTEDGRTRGRYVHEALALDHDGALDDETLDPALRPFVDAWRACKRDKDFRVLAFEQGVCDAVRGYAGTYDLLVREGDNSLLAPILIDIKSGQPSPWVCLQTAAYARASKTPEMPLLRRASLWLRPDSLYRLDFHTDRHDERVFLSALEVYQWNQQHS